MFVKQPTLVIAVGCSEKRWGFCNKKRVFVIAGGVCNTTRVLVIARTVFVLARGCLGVHYGSGVFVIKVGVFVIAVRCP